MELPKDLAPRYTRMDQGNEAGKEAAALIQRVNGLTSDRPGYMLMDSDTVGQAVQRPGALRWTDGQPSFTINAPASPAPSAQGSAKAAPQSAASSSVVSLATQNSDSRYTEEFVIRRANQAVDVAKKALDASSEAKDAAQVAKKTGSKEVAQKAKASAVVAQDKAAQAVELAKDASASAKTPASKKAASQAAEAAATAKVDADLAAEEAKQAKPNQLSGWLGDDTSSSLLPSLGILLAGGVAGWLLCRHMNNQALLGL